jgi:hypothetical protein
VKAAARSLLICLAMQLLAHPATRPVATPVLDGRENLAARGSRW